MKLDNLKKGANEVFTRLLNAMKSPEGYVHPQSYICCLSALAGYACQYDTAQVYVVGEKLDEDNVFMIVRGKSGKKYYFGEMLGKPMITDEYSVFAMVGGAVKHENGRLPDMEEIFDYISKTVGSGSFGKVRNCATGESITEYLKIMWKPMLKVAEDFCGRGEVHIVYGLALQKALMAFRQAVDVSEMARIAMESAVSASKVEFEKL